MLYATIALVAVLSIITAAFAYVTNSIAEIEATGHVKSGAILLYEPILDFGNVSSPSVTLKEVLITNTGETNTTTLGISVAPLIGGITLSWDYDGSPINTGQAITIIFTLTILPDTPMQDFILEISIFEV